MESFGPSPTHQYRVRKWGNDWIGIIAIDLIPPTKPDDRWTTWQLKLWRFTVGGSLPNFRRK
jgi:hypothetical protein